MHYINSTLSVFENMRYCIKMWRAFFINDVFHDHYKLPNLRTTWPEHNAPLFSEIIRLSAALGWIRGLLCFFCTRTGRDELYKPPHIRFSRRYPLGSFIERTDIPFREWDIAQRGNFNGSVIYVEQYT